MWERCTVIPWKATGSSLCLSSGSSAPPFQVSWGTWPLGGYSEQELKRPGAPEDLPWLLGPIALPLLSWMAVPARGHVIVPRSRAAQASGGRGTVGVVAEEI